MSIIKPIKGKTPATQKAIPKSIKTQKTIASKPKLIANAPNKAITAPAPSKSAQQVEPALAASNLSKHDRILNLLRHPDGASISKLMQATQWQAHSIRGYISGTIKKRLALKVTAIKVDGINHYHLEPTK